MDAVSEVCGCVCGKQRRNSVFAFIYNYGITNKTNLDWVVCLSETYLFDRDRQT